SLGLWMLPVSGSGERKRLATSGDFAYAPAIARQGRRLAYVQGVFDPNVWELRIDGAGAPVGSPSVVLSSTRIESNAAYSPDGKRIAFESTRSGNYEVWVADRNGSNAVQFTRI